MTGSFIKKFPELDFPINAEIKLAEKDNDFFEIKIKLNDANNAKNKFKLLKKYSLNNVIKILQKINSYIDINESNKNIKILKYIVKNTHIILYAYNKNKLSYSSAQKGKIILKARVPAPNINKLPGIVNYTVANPFTFPSYFATPPDQYPYYFKTYSLVNKGAIFWYDALNTIDNPNNFIVGIKKILVNTPSASFIPNSAGIVSLTGADFYFGCKNPLKGAYTDFYVYQPTFNNYLYKFSVLNYQFFNTVKFPLTKDIAIGLSSPL